MVHIKETISFVFPHGSARPTMDEMANFAKMLDADHGDMNTMYRIADERSIYIKFNTEASMQYALLRNPEQLTFHYANGKTVQVRMSDAGGNVQYIRIFDLPPEVPDKELSLVLGKYGKVKRLTREKFPVELDLNMYTGVRGVHMDVEKEIPSSLKFLDRKGNIFYSGNKDKCFHCKAGGHQMNSCPDGKARKQQEKGKQAGGKNQEKEKRNADEHGSATSSYAGVVAGAATMETIEVFDDEVMAIDGMTPEAEETRNESETSVVDNRSIDRHPLIQLAQGLADEYKKRQEEAQKKELRKKKEEEEAKPKSPPRKKKNFSLYKK